MCTYILSLGAGLGVGAGLGGSPGGATQASYDEYPECHSNSCGAAEVIACGHVTDGRKVCCPHTWIKDGWCTEMNTQPAPHPPTV
eukprot:10068723-Heterocapsa_arctica.AAC.1